LIELIVANRFTLTHMSSRRTPGSTVGESMQWIPTFVGMTAALKE
jgi:hypothetical protein